jgi:hypothetical protein
MTNLLKKAGLGVALAATALTVSPPAEAQRYGGYRHYDRGGDAAGAAIVGGIIGLGLGAVIASSNNNNRYNRGYYDRGYYQNGYGNGYGYQDRGYYPRQGYYNDQYRPQRCWVERRYDPYYGRGVPVRVCG